MCDTLVIVRPDCVWFAKNSDRDPNEAQLLDWQPARRYPPATNLQCTYLTIPQVASTAALLLSRPFWMWGAEMGTNEYGVCIGNEAVFTKEPYKATGLTGMDLVRLGLERGKTAKAAMEVIIQLLETHGQGGGCGLEHRAFSYHNSFLLADPGEAYVLETAGRKWALERVDGVRSISNGLTIPGFAEKNSDRLRSRVANCNIRQHRTMELGNTVKQTADLFALLRDHGSEGISYSMMNGALSGPCAHAGGLLAATQTTASWIAELTSDKFKHWVTATSSPCLSVFKPVSLHEPIDTGPSASEQYFAESYWWRHEKLFRTMLIGTPKYTQARNAMELKWLEEPPPSRVAFTDAESWITQHAATAIDRRPWYVKRYWRQRNKKAGLT